jgi:uncharacterized protein YyaL (SSP411 family)
MTEDKHTNRLIRETSPYLLQHAHNPVDWYPWGPEALERSRREDKPILLSIGYSACHWCHVMAHESFENSEIAGLMNQNFVCIKVDREERPDIDSIYMTSVQMMTGHGGWPLTVFLRPDLKPFYGGTYFPPSDRHGMPGFNRLLLAVSDSYQNRKAEVSASADAITDELRRMNRFRQSAEMLTTEILDTALSALSRNFDESNGGFGSAPKFPPSMNLMFLLRQYKRTGSDVALQMVELTLDKMASGGIYDHLGGGFHRYSVDSHWLVPHFEKMLYDNALLVRIYLYCYQATKNPRYRKVAEETLEYVMRDMTNPRGGFYSSEDADSEGEEGKFYTWTPEEIIDILGEEDGRMVAEYFGVTQSGNFEHGKSILTAAWESPEAFAAERKIDAATAGSAITRGKKELFYARDRRVRPGRDEKTLTAWNGLMLCAFAEAANILDRDDYRQVAVRNGDFLLNNMMRDGRLMRTYRDGEAKLGAYLEDYGFVIEALLSLYEATFDTAYFDHARQLADTVIELFSDESEAGFYFTALEHEKLITRMKEFYDNAIPSGNSAMAQALLKLSLMTGETAFQRPALGILRMMQQAMARMPTSFGYLLCSLDLYLSEPKEVALVGDPGSHEIRLFVNEVYSRYLPNKVIASSKEGDSSAAESIGLLRGKSAIDGRPTAYVCRDYVCLAPVTTPEELAVQLS